MFVLCKAVREQLHNAFVKAVLHNGVEIQAVKHHGRSRPVELTTALSLGAAPQFNGAVCTEPGCDRRYHLQWDHVDPVANGGPTTYKNLKPECTRHHVDKTERDRKAGLLTGARKERGP